MRLLAADTQHSHVTALYDESGNAVGLVGAVIKEAQCSVDIFRVKQGKFSSPAIRFLLTRLIQAGISSNSRSLAIGDKFASPDLDGESRMYGFTVHQNVRVKSWVSGVRSIHHEDVASALSLIGKSGVSSMSDPKLMAETAKATEHLLWPIKIIESPVSNFIVPIHPLWAARLFDQRYAKEMIFNENPRIGINDQLIYYRSGRNGNGIRAGSRILWYVTGSAKYEGSKSIRACSQLDHVQTGSASELFRSNRQYGVYQWSDIKRLIGPHGDNHEIMILRFSRTELLERPIPFSEIQASLLRNGLAANQIQSPTRVTPGVFSDLYQYGGTQ